MRLFVIFLLIPFLSIGQRIFLVGDAGEPKDPDPTFELLSQTTEGVSQEDVLIFLGDNLYPKGLSEKEHPERGELEDKLKVQLEAMKSFEGRSYMIPGNHDWAQGRNYGWERALNMEAYVNEYLGRDDAFVPANGCPGPIEITLNETAVLVVLNTQYFLHGWDKPGEDAFCESKSTLEALDELQQVVEKNKGKHVLIVGHHPAYTYGEHNGNFPLIDHIFPLTAINEKLYVPLPVIGSIHPLFRKSIGNIQDNTHPKYKAIMKAIEEAMGATSHAIFASGHEHSLQLINRGDKHFIVSGSGSKTTYLKKGKSTFGKSELGFSELELSENGRANIKFWGVKGGLLHESELYEKILAAPSMKEGLPSLEDSSISVAASEKYGANKGKVKWMGANYRDVWATPTEVPVFDIGREQGGLKILKKGGGMQTKSLRMESGDGRQYVLRSIEKYPENAIPSALRKTFAQDIVQDQISASHPYGAFIVPTLAEAAEIFHTNPKPVYIPDDPRFGEFGSAFAGTLAVYEERPNKEAAQDEWFGGGKDVEGTFDVLAKLKKDNDNSVDQNFVVRNRLFDMWIGDWDRHDDQWRWVEFEKNGKGSLYRPIPRDRDQVFFLNQGIIPKVAARKWALPKIEGFDEEVDWAPGISENARFFDRSFMNEPDWNDWQDQLAFLRSRLTDEVIEEAISNWPKAIQDLTAERVRTGLKARREDWDRYAREHYLFLSKEVEVIGSDKHEYFLVERTSENETKVTVWKKKRDGELMEKRYERIFKGDETKEVRLFGLDGEDVFEMKGGFKSKTKVRVIGGTDKDKFINAEGQNRLKNVLVYDRLKSTKFEGNSKGISRLSSKPEVNSHDRKSFKYDILQPLASAQINPDDGLLLGGGFTFTKHGWRKDPFASRHTVLANFSGNTDAFNFRYTGAFTGILGRWDFNPELEWQEPFSVNNFFGIGNETVFLQDQAIGPEDDDPIDFYRVRVKKLEVDLGFTKKLGPKGRFFVGAGYRSVRVEETPNRFISQELLPNQNFERRAFGKLRTGLAVDSRDSKVLPQRGTVASLQIERFEAYDQISTSFTRFSAEWAFFFAARLPSRLVIGNRVGMEHNSSPVTFINANTLGGRSNLRGFRRTRFHGETSFYHNLDLRLKLFSFRSYIFPGQFGILAFHDAGRVWVAGEESDKFHTGKGFGIWISPLNTAVVSLNYGFGEDENQLTFNLGFFF